MRKWILSIVGLAFVAGVTGCTSINSSDGGNMAIYPKTVAPTDNYRPLYTVDQTKRVKGNAQVHVLFGIFAWGDDAAFADNASISASDSMWSWFTDLFPDAKKLSAQAAFYNACKNADCDAVVSARYEVKNTNYWVYAKCNAEIKGFPAVQSGVEVVKPFPYYIDASGKLIILDKFVTPVKLFDESPTQIKKGFLF